MIRALGRRWSVLRTTRPPRTDYHSPMSVLFGRFFQLVGLVILPIGLCLGLVKDNIALEVRLLAIGGAFFVVGWLLARQKT